MYCALSKIFTVYGIIKEHIKQKHENLFIYITFQIVLVKFMIKDLIE